MKERKNRLRERKEKIDCEREKKIKKEKIERKKRKD